MAEKVWLITGASRGFGAIWARAALERGDKVAVTARNPAKLRELADRFGSAALALRLDVTDGAQVAEAVKAAHAHFGRIDVVLNNAGYTLAGAVEEGAEADVRALFDTNYFGPLRVIQAALPLLRAQGGGHFITVSSMAGVITAPMIGFYSSTKWALEAMHEALAAEVAEFGVKVTLIEPGAFATDFSTDASRKAATPLPHLSDLRARLAANRPARSPGDPNATAPAILAVVDSETPPLRVILGANGLAAVRAVYANRLATWESWDAVSKAAQGDAGAASPRGSEH